MMSKEIKHQPKSPTIIGRLMGLDSLPVSPQMPRQSEGLNNHCQWIRDEQFDNPFSYDTGSFCKDVYEVPHKPFASNDDRNNDLCLNRMSLVQQKFAQAKRLVTDENPLQSKEFRDAITFLSSNRDLFVKLLEAPNSPEFQNSSLLPESRLDEDLGGKLNRHCWSSDFSWNATSRLSQPTKIVVLRPSSRMNSDIEETKELKLSLLNVLSRQKSFGAMLAAEAMRSKDEALFSSELLYGYTGGESSYSRSESESMEEESGSLSDSEIATPTYFHPCDCTNELDSPCSDTSFSRASHSPESSDITEAKKRLADRLCLVAPNVNCRERKLERASSGTLAELLSYSPGKKREGLNISSRKEQDIDKHSSFMSLAKFRKGLSRSNSAPNLLSDCRATSFEFPSLINEPVVKKEKAKANTVKSGFRDRVSSLFFSGHKKKNSNNPASLVSDHKSQLANVEACCDEGLFRVSSDVHFDEVLANKNQKDVATSVRDNRSLQALIRAELKQPSDSDPPFSSNNLLKFSERTMVSDPQALGRSGPIESFARTLSTEFSSSEESAKPLKISSIFCKADKEHEQFLFIKSLISSARLDNRSGKIFSRWHSVDSPLNPMLLEEYTNTEHSDINCMLPSSCKRLLFDCANAALINISDRAIKDSYPWTRTSCKDGVNAAKFRPLAEEVWRKVSSWDYWGKYKLSKFGKVNDFVNMLVKIEGSEWKEDECGWSEMYELCRDIAENLLEELVEETLSQLIQLVME